MASGLNAEGFALPMSRVTHPGYYDGMAVCNFGGAKKVEKDSRSDEATTTGKLVLI